MIGTTSSGVSDQVRAMYSICRFGATGILLHINGWKVLYVNFTFRHIDDVLSLSNAKFGVFVDRIYPIELEIEDTTDTAWSASYLDLPHIIYMAECEIKGSG
jgi:hypothetical protein